jgi:hypothetical protein
MHHHVILALYDHPETAKAAADDLATAGIPEGALHASQPSGETAWDWIRRYNLTGERIERLQESARGAGALVVRAADADVTRVLAVLQRNGAQAIEDLGSDLGGTEAGLHPPDAAM